MDETNLKLNKGICTLVELLETYFIPTKGWDQFRCVSEILWVDKFQSFRSTNTHINVKREQVTVIPK